MANTTLAMMQAIEAEAQAVLDSYELEIAELKEQAEKDLAAIAQTYDQETAEEVAKQEENAEADLAHLRQEIQATISANEAAVREALTDRRDDLVQAIVEKVVARYGH
ncbi:V/A-type H+-transporting ATPase subunit G/H [Streptococcus rupicaprae]|uniref:V/A-type H+-transporting ATPase subunit G/H n=1 Tax=Streptococcus rupicaprae TaxID=759619 RepID=A0ABV2FJW8_9STRE